jgi:hypothetical protein
VTDRGLFSRPLLSRLAVTEEEKKRQVDNRRFCIPTVAREFMKDTGPFDPLVQSTLHGPQGYCWLIPRPEEDPTKPIEVGAKYSLPRGPAVQRFEALEGEEEVAKSIGKKGSKKKKSLKSIDAELTRSSWLRCSESKVSPHAHHICAPLLLSPVARST